MSAVFFKVSGLVKIVSGEPAEGIRVSVFDKDMRHEQLLGTATTDDKGFYSINYSADQFRRAEKKSADLIVRAFDAQDNMLAESEIVFNAPDQVRINLTIKPLPVTPPRRLSELERLQESIEPIREDVAYADFTDDDLTFLTEESIVSGRSGDIQRPTIRQHLEFLRLAAQFEQQTALPLAAFYGWFRENQPQVLADLLDVPIRTLQAALLSAIKNNVIPDMSAELSAILERIRGLRFEQGRLVSHRFVIQLLNAESKRPLAGYNVEVSDPAAEPEERNLGTLFTDGQGVCVIVFTLPGNAPETATRRLSLNILDEEQTVAQARVEASSSQKEVMVVNVRLKDDLLDDASRNDLLAPPDTAEGDSEALQRRRGRVKLKLLFPNQTDAQREALLAGGKFSVFDVAKTTRDKFVNTFGPQLGGDAATYATHFAAKETAKVLQHAINNAWIKNVTAPGDEPPDPDIPAGVNDVLNGLKKCGCKDCDSAVSPAAYLAQLLAWTLDHIKDGNASIEFEQLEADLHQPFGDLPANCGAVEEQVRQVRICIEVLWRFTGLLENTDLQFPTPFRVGYRRFRKELYRSILAHLGISFDQLRIATLNVAADNPIAEQVASQRQAVADVLGIDDSHLEALFFDIDQEIVAPSENELEQRFGFRSTRHTDVLTNSEMPDLIGWQRERLETVWQQQDWSPDAYSGNDRTLPFVDPALIDESYLRTPRAENPAFTLLQARRGALNTHRQQLVHLVLEREDVGLVPVLENELGSSIDALRELNQTLRAGSDPQAIGEAQAAIDGMNLTIAGFSRLMETDAREILGEMLGVAAEPINEEWEGFDILTRIHRLGLFPAWIKEENDRGLVFGSKFFWFPVSVPAPVNPWLASNAERSSWEEALRSRYRQPLIDPDQISKDQLTLFRMLPKLVREGIPFRKSIPEPFLGSFPLWHSRRNWVDDRLFALQTAREGLPNSLERLQATLAASTLHVDFNTLDALAESEAAGNDITPRLAQLSLDLRSYRFLAEVRILALGNASGLTEKLQEVDAILIQGEKRLEFAEWREQERNLGLTMHPLRFELNRDLTKISESPQTKWLHHPLVLENWFATLEARDAQLQALEEGLAKAVSDAEEHILPQLRNLLIMHEAAPNDAFDDIAERLQRQLLIDMRMDGCHMTTRVSQAIETLQALIRGVYTQEHPASLQHLTLDAEEDYESEWPVIGSYATWRAFMLAYLYPENLLHLTPPPRPSYGFKKLKESLPSRVEPKDACEAANEYSRYFEDVCNLEVQASCQIRTFVETSEPCAPTGITAPSRLHLFARAKTSGLMYVARLDPSKEFTDTTTSWEPLTQYGKTERILGATPHFTPDGSRYVVLFFSLGSPGRMSFHFAKYDVDRLSWSSKDKELPLPRNGEKGFSAAVIQKRGADPNAVGFPTIVAVKPVNDAIYINQLDDKAEPWTLDTWIPLFGPRAFDMFVNVVGLIQRGNNEYVILAQLKGRTAINIYPGMYYRFLYLSGVGKDDLTWKAVTNTGNYRGAFSWFSDTSTFLFYEDAGAFYKPLGLAGPIKQDTSSKFRYHFIGSTRSIIEDILAFNDEWLEPYVGVSLKYFRILRFQPDFFVPSQANLPGTSIDPITDKGKFPSTVKKATLSDGTLDLDLLSLYRYQLEVDDIFIPVDEALFVYQQRSFYEIQLKYQYIQQFLDYISPIYSGTDVDANLRLWKFADDQIKKFSYEGLSLKDLILRFFDNLYVSKRSIYNLALGIQLPTSTSFKERDKSSELRSARQLPHQIPIIAPSSGDERTPGLFPMKAIAFQINNRPSWARLRRDGDSLTARKLLHLAPFGTGPFDIAPIHEINTLHTRKPEIEDMYKSHLNSPPSVQNYLKEAYNCVPMYLGYELQRNSRYEEALIWYRQVYDFLQAEVGAQRKIDFSLIHEQHLALDFQHADEWLNDASNTHAIAATRKNTYTRHALLMIIRCLIEYADTLFSHDNVTDNARARELYTQALKLLDLLKLGASDCDNIIGELEIEVVESGLLPLQQFQAALAQITDPGGLSPVTTALRTFSQDGNRLPVGRLSEAIEGVRGLRETVSAARAKMLAPKPMKAVLQTKRKTVANLENRFLAHSPSRSLLTMTQRQRHEDSLLRVADVIDIPAETLVEQKPQLPWLRQARPAGEDGAARPVNLALFKPTASPRLTALSEIKKALPMASLTASQPGGFAFSGLSFDFCIPQNPVVQALRRRAENNLIKLRTCRNIAGFLRPLDPYGAPIGIASGMVSPDGRIFSGIVQAPPTIYRFSALIARAKELVSISQQIEASYQAALEAAEGAAFADFQAEQGVVLAQARVSLQDLRVTQANNEMGLARLQKSSAAFRENTYAGWIAAGLNEHETSMLKANEDARAARVAANAASGAAEAAGIAANIVGDTRFIVRLFKQGAIRRGLEYSALLAQQAATLAATFETGIAINAEARAQSESLAASFERRNDEWQFQQGLAALDVRIGDQQIVLAQNQIDIVRQERVIAGLEQTHAIDLLNFLLNKVFNEEMYRWIASVLADVYRFFLQEATVIARLAERQLAFERQEGPLRVIQSDYWSLPAEPSTSAQSGNNTDRLGLTGSARLLKDIYQLDNYAFETRQRKQTLTLTQDLAEMFPLEFQRLRETGLLIFETPLSLIDRQMPGYYLCLIQQVSISVVALIPPTYGIRATLTSAGSSRAVVGGDTFQTVTIQNLPERIALTSATTSSSVVELQPDSQSLLNSFEGSGFDMLWELLIPKAANRFDYNSMATVLFTVTLTALHSFDYEREVIERMDRRQSFDRAFDFRQVFADAWYDMNNPDQTDTPMTVRFDTRRSDFPPNLTNLAIQHVVLYLVRQEGAVFEQQIGHLHFTAEGTQGSVGGPTTTNNGRVSTRSGNGTNWLPMIGLPPIGQWELSFPNTVETRNRFPDEDIENILLVLTCAGMTPNWPT